MKLKLFKTLPAVEITITGDWEEDHYVTKTETYQSETEFNESLHLYIIYLDFYYKANTDTKYNHFDISEYKGLKDALKFYFENEFNVTLEQIILEDFVAEMTCDTIPFSVYGGYSFICGPENIQIQIKNEIYYIDYNENDVKSAIDKLMKG